jgi:tRNA(Ile)-lysidine synthase
MDEQAARFRADLEALTGAAPDRLALAVSGGPDSLALLLLASAAYPGRVQAATVDHGLRRQGAAEAEFVADLCGRLGVPHATFAAEMNDSANLQAAARERRYALLAQWALEIGAGCLLTAHHLDDQAETLVMRLVRGSGLAGLSGIRAVNPPLVRPLLGWRRAELAAIVDAAGIPPVADPSNEDERFDRVRVRKRLADADWLDPASLARSAAALAEAEEALGWAAERLWRTGRGRHDRSDRPAGRAQAAAGAEDDRRAGRAGAARRRARSAARHARERRHRDSLRRQMHRGRALALCPGPAPPPLSHGPPSRPEREVTGSDGGHVGTVDCTRDDRLILTRSDEAAGGVHHMIPCAWIERVDDKVVLNIDAAEARRRWQADNRSRALFEREDSGRRGPHVLNRSFAGTYPDEE